MREKSTKRAYQSLENDAKRLCTEVGSVLDCFKVSSRSTGPKPRVNHQRAANRAVHLGAGKTFILQRQAEIMHQVEVLECKSEGIGKFGLCVF